MPSSHHSFGTVLVFVFLAPLLSRDVCADLPVDEDGHVIRFDRDILPILRDRCLECHGPEDAKNDFRVDDRESMMDYVEPQSAADSTLYADYLATDYEDLVMPPPSKGGPLSPAELALIRVWIDEGASWPEDVTIKASDEADGAELVEDPVPAEIASQWERAWIFQGFFHPATVHFPIALFCLGAGFVVLGWIWPPLGSQIPLACLIIGMASAIVASVMGWSFSVHQGWGDWTKEFDIESNIFWHRWLAVAVTAISMLSTLCALLAFRSNSKTLDRLWRFGLIACAALVGLVGHKGGELTYGENFYLEAFEILTGEDQEAPAASEADESNDH